jgi:hypothetical protein
MEDLLYKIENRMFKEDNEVTYRGEKFRLGGEKTHDSWDSKTQRVVSVSGGRDMIGPGGVVGSFHPETGQITVSGSGFTDDEKGGFKGPPRQSGWEISWEVPNPERLAGAGKTGVFFPREKDVDYEKCRACDGKKKEPGSRITPEQAKERGVAPNPKGKLCSNCYGFGILNPRVDAYANSLRKQGRAPKVRVSRGVSRYPTVGTEI